MTASATKMKAFPPKLQNQCFGCGSANSAGLQLEFSIAEDGSVFALAEIAESFCGNPGYVHGGVIAVMLDEAMSKAIRANGRASVTRKLETEYLRPVATETPLRIEGRLLRVEGNQNWAEAAIKSASGRVLAQGKGLFIEIKPRS